MTDKQVPPGRELIQPLQFGSWPLEEINKVVAEVGDRYDLSKHELSYVDRGRYVIDEEGRLVETFGKIVWKRVRP